MRRFSERRVLRCFRSERAARLLSLAAHLARALRAAQLWLSAAPRRLRCRRRRRPQSVLGAGAAALALLLLCCPADCCLWCSQASATAPQFSAMEPCWDL